MTPTQEKALAVALDGLREAFGDDLQHSAALLGILGADLTILIEDWSRLVATSANCPECHRWRGHNSRCAVGVALGRLFSLVEKPATASTHRPEVEPSSEVLDCYSWCEGEGCPVCGRGRFSDRFPGAGAG